MRIEPLLQAMLNSVIMQRDHVQKEMEELQDAIKEKQEELEKLEKDIAECKRTITQMSENIPEYPDLDRGEPYYFLDECWNIQDGVYSGLCRITDYNTFKSEPAVKLFQRITRLIGMQIHAKTYVDPIIPYDSALNSYDTVYFITFSYENGRRRYRVSETNQKFYPVGVLFTNVEAATSVAQWLNDMEGGKTTC